MRLIDADALPEGWYNEVPETIENAPTIYAVPVVYGRWIHDINNLYGCSECCARETMSHRKLKNYCPNCGAAMNKAKK